MYEKMLNKQEVPSMEDLIAYCGANGTLFQELNSYLTEEWNTDSNPFSLWEQLRMGSQAQHKK